MMTPKPRTKITERQKCTIRALHQVSGLSVASIIKKNMKLLSNLSKSAIYKEAKVPIGDNVKKDRRFGNKSAGRKPLFSRRTISRIERTRKSMRSEYGSFSSLNLQSELGMMQDYANTTFRRYLNKMGVKWLPTKRKGVLTKEDKEERMKFAKDVQRNHGVGDEQKEFWRTKISMFTDIVGFEYKSNPFGHAQTPQAREWRRIDEAYEVTRKGQKEGKTQVRFLIGIGYDRGVAMVEQVATGLTGVKFANIISSGAFDPGLNEERTIIQDNCPVQNSAVALEAFEEKNINLLKIPPRSPDLNAIENMFNQMRDILRKQAIDRKIRKETKAAFTNRCIQTLGLFSCERVNNLVDSYPKRMDEVIKRKGGRTKY